MTLANNDDLAVGVSRTHAMSALPFINHEVHCFDRSQNIANFTISLAIRNDLELVSRINQIIQNLLDGGLLVKWSRDHQIRAVRKENLNADVTTSWKPFSVENFVFGFHFVYFPGLFLAVATLCAELYIAKRRRAPNYIAMWGILSDFFDGHRRGNILTRRKRR